MANRSARDSSRTEKSQAVALLRVLHDRSRPESPRDRRQKPQGPHRLRALFLPLNRVESYVRTVAAICWRRLCSDNKGGENSTIRRAPSANEPFLRCAADTGRPLRLPTWASYER